MKTPEPGIHYDVPFSDYLKWDAISNSKLSLFAKSPAHYQMGYKPPSRALTLGSLVHCGVLENDSLARRYAVVPNYHLEAENVDSKGKPSKSKATKWYKERVRAFAHGLPSEVEIISQESYDKMQGVVDAILADKRASEVLTGGKVEVSMLWRNGSMLCKGRIDLLKNDIFVDLKTTSSCATFPTAIRKYAYHRQCAWYADGLRAITGKSLTPWLVAVETEPPFGVMAAPMCSSAVVQGIGECEDLLRRIAECEFLGEWPGYESPEYWDLPE